MTNDSMHKTFISWCETALPLDEGPPAVINLMPIGEITASDGRKWVVADPVAVIRATHIGRSGLVIDYDHQTDTSRRTGGTAPAAGWIKMLDFIGGDFIRAHVEWTPEGRVALNNRNYRFISPVIVHDKNGNVIRFLRAGLTNDPALPQLGALANKQAMNDDLNAVLSALNLPEHASPEDAVKRIGELTQAHADPRAFVPRAQVESMLSDALTQVAKARDERINTKIDAATKAGKLPPALRDWAVSLASVDEASFDAFAAKMPVIVGPAVGDRPICQLPRSEPTAAPGVVTSVCAALGITAEALCKNLPEESR